MKATDSAVASLNDIHKDCLRLAIYHYSSKEIGRTLGISRHTVDQRLRHATHRLGASNRFEAARMLADFEADATAAPTPHPFVYKPPYIPTDRQAAIEMQPAGARDDQLGIAGTGLEDAQAPFVFGHAFEEKQAAVHPVSLLGVAENSQSAALKLSLAIGIATMSLFAFVAAIAGLEVLSRIQ